MEIIIRKFCNPYILVFLALISYVSSFAQNISEKYASTITEDELKEMLYKYASDDFQGRETGTEGQRKAVNYIKTFYKNHDISAALPKNNYFQKVPLKITKPIKGIFKVGDINYDIGKDVFIFNSDVENFSAKDIVYVGFGIEDSLYSDYSDLDVRGKVVFSKKGEPMGRNGRYKISRTGNVSDWSISDKSTLERYEKAKKRQAKAFILYDEDALTRAKSYYEELERNDKMIIDNKNKRSTTPLIVVSRSVAFELFPDFEKRTTTKVLRKNKVSMTLVKESKKISSENVVAYIKGAEKPEEYVILSAHLDHIGMDSESGQVFNGADDDGSGTVAILEIAEAFKQATDEGHRPKRSVVFLNMTGEEKGLLGSKYYTRHPVFPLAETVVDLNIDMVGRTDPERTGDRNYIYLIGSDKLSTDLHNLSEEINRKCCGLELDYKYNDENDPNRFYYRSDHYNFAKNNIPIIFYFNGVHADYHKVTDTPDKINYDLLTNRARLVFHTAWIIANRPRKLLVDK